jgi:hypothetical protein
MKWKDLKQFCDSLGEDQLEKNVILWREDDAINRIGTCLLEEDHYIGKGEEGCYPESEASKPLRKLKKVYSKGDAILYEYF